MKTLSLKENGVFRNLKIAYRMTLMTLVGIGIILGTITYYDYHAARRILEAELRARAEILAQATAGEMEVVKRAVEKVVQEIAIVLESNQFNREQIFRLLHDTTEKHQELYGVGVALHNFASADGSKKAFIPYVNRKENGFTHIDAAQLDYAFETWDWYHLPKELGTPIWTEPYFGKAGQILEVTYCVPLYSQPDHVFQGVVIGDVSLTWLTNLLKSLDIAGNGYAFIVSRKGTFVAHPARRLVMRETIFSLAERQNKPELRKLGQDMMSGKSGFVPFTSFVNEQSYWLAHTPVLDTGWSLAALFPQKEIMAKLIILSRTKLILGGIGGLALTLLVLAIAHSISKPIRQLDLATQMLAAGNLDADLPCMPGKNEVAGLTRSFAKMQKDLKTHIEELKATTAARERIDSDLRIAREIQMSLVPHHFSFDPPQPKADIFALLDPAREVGGDFYDFFMCDDKTLYIAIGDASGKGVPASLFMAVTQAYLRAFVHEDRDPARALTKLNNSLAQDNDTSMFITVFCALIDLETGACRYASGGHNPPFILRHTGQVEILHSVKGPLVGPMEGMSYEAGTIAFEKGDLLFTYTDGVVEAESDHDSFYGEERTIAKLAKLQGQSPEDIIRAVRDDLRNFAGSAPQSDDITMLAVAYKNNTDA